MSYSTPLIVFMGVMMVIIAWLTGVEPWMIAVGALIALTMFFVERRKT